MHTTTTCSRCGMEQRAWRGSQGQGYRQGGQVYCCEGCAQGTGCTCGTSSSNPQPGQAASQRRSTAQPATPPQEPGQEPPSLTDIKDM